MIHGVIIAPGQQLIIEKGHSYSESSYGGLLDALICSGLHWTFVFSLASELAFSSSFWQAMDSFKITRSLHKTHRYLFETITRHVSNERISLLATSGQLLAAINSLKELKTSMFHLEYFIFPDAMEQKSCEMIKL